MFYNIVFLFGIFSFYSRTLQFPLPYSAIRGELRRIFSEIRLRGTSVKAKAGERFVFSRLPFSTDFNYFAPKPLKTGGFPFLFFPILPAYISRRAFVLPMDHEKNELQTVLNVISYPSANSNTVSLPSLVALTKPPLTGNCNENLQTGVLLAA